MKISFTGRETMLIKKAQMAGNIERHEYIADGQILPIDEAKALAKQIVTPKDGIHQYLSPYNIIEKFSKKYDASSSYAISHGNVMVDKKPAVDVLG